MTTYTLFDGDNSTTGLSAVDAAQELLSHDGNEYEVRPDADHPGWYSLWISHFSRNSTCGGQPLVRAAIPGAFVHANNAGDAWDKIALAVIESGAWDRDNIYVLTEQEICAGQRVEGGAGEDHDTGRVVQMRGLGNVEALVSWDSGVREWTPISLLRAE